MASFRYKTIEGAVLAVVRIYGPMSPREVVQELRGLGLTFVYNIHYVHLALKTLLDSDLIVPQGKLYKAKPSRVVMS